MRGMQRHKKFPSGDFCIVLLLFAIALSIGACGGGSQAVGWTSQNPTTPTVTVTPASSSITTAQSLAATITVSGASGTPSGSVVLSSGAYTSSATTLTAGSASITIAADSLAVGSDTLTAKYIPDSASYATYNSASGTASVTVTQPTTPTVTVTPASSSITTAKSLAVTITVSGASGMPSGSVVLSSGAYTSSATTLTAGSASITIAADSLAVGSDTLTAKYTPGGASYVTYNSASGTASVTVTQPTTPTVTVTPGSGNITTAQSLAVTITVSGSSGTPRGSVVVSSGAYTSRATTLTAGSASITIAADSLAVGSDTLTAKYAPDAASSSIYGSASGQGSVTVTKMAMSNLTAPANGGTVSPQQIQFSWIPVPGVINYTLWIGTTAGAKDALYYTTGNTGNPTGITSTTATLQPGITYYATLFTLTSAGYTTSASMFQTAATTYLTAPASGASICAQQVQFSWAPVPGVINYSLWIGTTAGARDAFSYSSATSTSATATLMPGSAYYATIWTYTASGSSSSASTFQTTAASYLTAPANGGTVSPQQIRFSWTPVPGVISYTLWIGTTAGAQNALYFATATGSNPSSVTGTTANLQPGVRYHARIWTYAATGSSYTDSSFQTSTTASLTGIAITASTDPLNVSEGAQLTALGTYSDGSTADVTSTVTWSSGGPTILWIASDESSVGLSVGIAPGTVTVTATENGITATASVTVSDTDYSQLWPTPSGAPVVMIGDHSVSDWPRAAFTTRSVTLAGVHSDTCADVRARFATDVVAAAPRFVVISCGVYDLLQGRARADIMADIDSMVTTAQAAGIVPVLTEVTPVLSACASSCPKTAALLNPILALNDDPEVSLFASDGNGLVTYAAAHNVPIAYYWRQLAGADGYAIQGADPNETISAIDGITYQDADYTLIAELNRALDQAWESTNGLPQAPVSKGPAWLPPNGQTIVLIGDSVPSDLMLNRMTTWTMINEGISGQTCGKILQRFVTDVVAQNPGIVIIDCGINDMAAGKSRSEIMANIDAMVNIAEANGIEPVLAELTPVDPPCPSPCQTILGQVHTEVLAQMDDPLVPLNQADGGGLVPYALKHHLRIAWIWRALSLADGYVIPGSTEYPTLSTDGLHPTLSGRWTMYSSIQNALNPPVN